MFAKMDSIRQQKMKSNKNSIIMYSWNEIYSGLRPGPFWSDPSLYDNNNSNDCPPGTILRLPNVLPGKDNYDHLRRQSLTNN